MQPNSACLTIYIAKVAGRSVGETFRYFLWDCQVLARASMRTLSKQFSIGDLKKIGELLSSINATGWLWRRGRIDSAPLALSKSVTSLVAKIRVEASCERLTSVPKTYLSLYYWNQESASAFVLEGPLQVSSLDLLMKGMTCIQTSTKWFVGIYFGITNLTRKICSEWYVRTIKRGFLAWRESRYKFVWICQKIFNNEMKWVTRRQWKSDALTKGS